MAIEDFQMALKIDSIRQPNYYFYLSDAYLYNLQSRDASQVMDKAMSLFPNHAETILRSARLRLVLTIHTGNDGIRQIVCKRSTKFKSVFTSRADFL